MKCSVCQRELAPELSMCVRCGAMRDDSVREELESSLAPISAPLSRHEPAPAAESRADPLVASRPSAAVERPAVTSDLGAKKTSPTLAEFATQKATLPDWRLQVQNSVRQRRGRSDEVLSPGVGSASALARLAPTRGANALKPEAAIETTAPDDADQRVANALKRIEESRRAFLPSEKAREGMRVAKEASRKFPYAVVARSDELPNLPAPITRMDEAMALRPKLISSLRIEKRKYDTNKLVPIPEAAHMSSSFATEDAQEAAPKRELKEDWSQKIEISGETVSDVEMPKFPFVEEDEIGAEEIDDLAPLSMRFNAGLFDLIAGGFATFILLSPFLALSEGWFSGSGLLLFATVMIAVMFVYLTSCVAFLGQTLGMRIFSLELIDVEQSEIPTLHQAAVNSVVYLFSLMLAGVGFIPMLFNEEKRAAHDLVSGTILVRSV